MRQSLVVSLFGGPGCGKSTLCADIFAELKWAQIDCEMVLEYAKEMVWGDHLDDLHDQVYLFGKQEHRMRRLNGKVDVIITDSPLLLVLVYNKGTHLLNDLALETHKKFDNLNIFVKREKEYNPNGRIQTEDEAKSIDIEILKMLSQHNIPYLEVIGEKESTLEITKMIKKRLGGKYGE